MWESVNLSWPESASTIQRGAKEVVDNVSLELKAAVQRVEKRRSDASFGRCSLSEESVSLLGLRGELDRLLAAGTVITVNPYQFEVGERLDSGCYLSPINAVNLLSEKFRDLSDIHRPDGQLFAVAIMLTSHDITNFAFKLREISQVFALPDWCQCARQATALSTNERDKLQQAAPIIQPRFRPFSSLNANPVSDYLSSQGGHIATLESLASDATDVIGKLSALADKRSRHLNEISDAINALKAMKGSVFSMRLSGSTDTISSLLKSTQVPNKHPLTIASVLVGHEPMPFFEELLCSH
ncbi:hypothetical protein [Vibrio rotiferianus]|uniref:hypothetical protein n=1 Tax=Vibrio rotiferianus TaxID=190895 RepID=UPI00390A93DE